jgi:arylsulfatase A-like enzyme
VVPPRNAQPEGFQANSRSDQPVSLLDVYPTVADMLGVNKRKDLDGHSLLPLIKNPQKKRSHPAVTAIGRGTWSIRDSKWRFIHYFDGARELYDLKKDPEEWTNLINNKKYSKVVERLSKHIPEDTNWKYYVRYKDFKAVVPADGSNMMLYGPGAQIIYEAKDVAKEYPKMVQTIETYLKSNGVTDKNVTMLD